MPFHHSLQKRVHAIKDHKEIVQMKKWKIGFKNDIFIIVAKNIGCWYTKFEPPRRGGSNGYPQSMFWIKIELEENRYTPQVCKFQYDYIKVGCEGVHVGHVLRIEFHLRTIINLLAHTAVIYSHYSRHPVMKTSMEENMR